MKFSQIYARLCKIAGKSEKLKNVQDPSEDLQRNLEFIGLEISGEEIVALASLGALIGSGIAGVALLITWIFNFSLIIPVVAIFLPALFYLIIGWYPSWKAENERTKGMGNVPRVISYMTVALKINPNLERAARFSAENSGKSLGGKFRDELWKACIGAHGSAKEALSKFGRRWKEQSKELKRSIDLIKSSVTENSETSRKQVLDRALKTSFEGARNRMESFAANLKLPTMVIYGIGVLLPLVLLAVLPVLSSTGIQVSSLELALIYCFALPLTVYVLKKQVLAKRPAAFPPSSIPSKDDEVRAVSVSIPLALVPVLAALLLGLPPSLTVLAVLWGLTSSIAAFCYLSSVKTYQIRKKNRRLEKEFCDSLAPLGNQLKSGRPVEDALRRTAETTRDSEISKILESTSTNLKAGGLNIKSAFFDPEVGSLKEIHSVPVKSTFRMLTALLDRSTRAAGDALLHAASHLKKLKEVEDQIRRTLREIVSSMRSVALFFAPLVASITVQLQQILSKKTSGMPLFGSGVQASSATFLGALGFYIVVLTALLSTYTVEIERGNDGLAKRMGIARALPVAMTVFTLGLIVGNQMLSFLTA